MKLKYVFLYWLSLIVSGSAWAQTIPAGYPVLEEALRRKQLLGELDPSLSFNLRPLRSNFLTGQAIYEDYSFFIAGNDLGPTEPNPLEEIFSLLPIRNSVQFNSGRPYGSGNGIMIPNVGGQNYTTGGFSLKYRFLNIQFQPEVLWAQNRAYEGF